MIKVLVIIEDANLRGSTESILRKVGCVVDSVSQDAGAVQKVLGLNPDLILVSGTKKIQPKSLVEKLRGIHGAHFKIGVMLDKSANITLAEFAGVKVDAFVELPMEPVLFLQTISKAVDGKAGDLAERFLKKAVQSSININIDPSEHVGGKVLPFPMPKSGKMTKVSLPTAQDNKARNERNAKLLRGVKVAKESTIDREKVKKVVRDQNKGWDQNYLEQIDAEKRQFARLLFKK